MLNMAALAAMLWAAGGLGAPHGPLPPLQPRTCAQTLFAGSSAALRLPRGATVSVLGAGRIFAGDYVSPAHLDAPAEALIVASRDGSAGALRLDLVPAPPLASTLASVDAECGITLYDRTTLARLGTFATATSPADATYAAGALAWTPAEGSSATRYDPSRGLSPLALGSDASALLYDARSRALIQANRDAGTLTVLEADGARRQIAVGQTPEALVRTNNGDVLVSVTNDDRIVEVDPRSGRVVRSLRVGQRPFGLAVDAAHDVAFVALNSIAGLHASRAGGVVAVDLRTWRVRAVRHDANLALGVAFDATHRRLFVTEELGQVLVLDEQLRSLRPPLHPCALPWLPSIDGAARRLFVACPRESLIAVYNLATLRESAHMTSSPYPLRLVVP